MKKLSIKIVDFLLKNQYIEKSMYNIYQYGMQVTLEIGLSFITSILICFLWGKIAEGIIFFALFIPLRSYLGGFHLKSYKACYILSCLTLIIVLKLSSLEPHYSISWVILSISIIILLKEAKNEKLKDAAGKYFYPRICIIIFIDFIFGITFTILGSFSKLFLVACTNILVLVSKLLEIHII